MRTNSLKTAILAGALVVFFALPSFASAAQVVPPGNSAATQYTQTFPTSGGNVAVGDSIGGDANGGEKKAPEKVIGKKTTRELESHGAEGTAVAELAAESAPTPEQPEAETTSEGSSGSASNGSGHKSDGGGKKPADGNQKPPKEDAQSGAGAGPGGAGPGGGGSGTKPPAGGAAATNTAVAEAAGSGSSGISEVLGQATGASSGQMGIFLPLVLIGALALALVYAWRRREHEPRATS